ncbi:DUF4349 domain-containing protein [Chitinimonas sp. JJ19]|uniref:DUF4349 domain-containing protein n=1 Tax=Chitinimonas sp. JJ19 TaxID=3109352 RepID=UPI0030013BE6
MSLAESGPFTKVLMPLLLALALTACGQKSAETTEDMPPMAAFVPPPEIAEAKPSATPSATPRRYLAISHYLEVETAAEQVEPLWRQLQAKVVSLGGEVVSAELSRGDARQPTATLSLRLPPQHVPSLYALLAQGGELVNTRTDSEDKTAEVVDVDARLKNLTEARDRLRQMLAERPGKLSDVLEVQQALTETQSQLDSFTGQRKALADQTDKVKLELTLRPPRSMIERSALSPLRDAWHSMGYTASDSLAGLLTLVASLLPWLLLLIPMGLFIRRAWRKRRAAKM